MFTGFSNILENVKECRKICKSVTMVTQGSHHGALQIFFRFSLPSLPFYLYLRAELFYHSETYVHERKFVFGYIYKV